ncbi:hypothetical protein AK88_01563 [Plasmodium fragile]|uniref:Potassium channel tetramerisation-type BTB domain-containing protein n=1 Tax=Plasmodium fragile TaxID=5857 RepID=A0A0D9QPH8_PLAFR|nr:uncharacterized protein AK88_01563 [Plasmodium fragile]KJP88682.1 hypothetical protein AK88_01563 [Plasmodium fragile]
MDSTSGDNVISINVGGTIYMTTLNLICKYRNSRLCEIVLEKLKALPDFDTNQNRKEIFIDRNGSRFEYILDFLRDGVLICENDINVLTRILIEAVYFKLSSLIKILKKKIELLYSNMGNNVNKNIFKNIIGTLEEKKNNKIKSKAKNNSISRMLNKISAQIKKHNEMKCCTVKKKKKKIHNVHFLNKINLLTELNDEDKSPTKECTLLSTVPVDNCKEEKQYVSTKHQGEKVKNDEQLEGNNVDELNLGYNIPKIILPNSCPPGTQTKMVDYNITNNFINEEDKLKSKNNANGSTRINCLLKNIERKEYSPIHLSPNWHLKNRDSKKLSFAESTNETAQNGTNDTVGTSTESLSKSLSPSSIGGANYSGYSRVANYANSSRDVDKACYKYNNYTYNNSNNPSGKILVYSEIDDIEETSPFPILSNVNLGEQIFSTTVDF